ncbi:cysteine--tRNA ligase [Methanococcoides sp. FTZ1]|uniref:cysteine--tRNA ligase n=1 Tax=Methanococcoides sp. FTZ1 TaxID=3439061 RepID=UPI003F866A01
MLTVYNTLTRKKETFRPIKDGEVSIYACGPTVYSLPHIGNYRTFLMTDSIVRTLEYLGYNVKLVMNITDIDDKTIRDSKKEGLSLRDFTEKYTREFFRGLDMLNIKHASAYPKATENVEGMIGLTKKLVEKGMAYEKDGSVYFRISSFKDYGKLSKIDMDQIKIGASVDVDEYDKENPRDFVLLKASTPEEIERGIFYESSWGKIRPGWHTECSVMSMKEFGSTLDIHIGGVDLIFPHHENEIAQSEGATGKTFVNYWIHVEHLLVDGEKMSKSKGNVFSLSDIVEKYSGELVRFMFLSVHYRKQLNYTDEFAENAKNNYQKLKETLENLEFALERADKESYQSDKETLEGLPILKDKFMEALADDFNTPKAIKVFRDLSRAANKYIETGNNEFVLKNILDLYREFGDALGLFSKIKKEKIPEIVMKLVSEREIARANKDWQKADELRTKIKDSGYIIEDSKEGAKIKKI